MGTNQEIGVVNTNYMKLKWETLIKQGLDDYKITCNFAETGTGTDALSLVLVVKDCIHL